MSLPAKVLIIDDDLGDLNMAENFLKTQDVQTVKCSDWESALYQFNQSRFEVVIIKLNMGGMAGPTLIQKWRNHEMESKRNCGFVISLDNKRDPTKEALLQELGDIATVDKPFKLPSLLSAIVKAKDLSKQREALAQVDSSILRPLIKQKKYDKAKAVAQEKLQPWGEKGQLLTAQVYEHCEDLNLALTAYRELVRKNPTNMRYLNEQARMEMQLGNFQAAQEAYERADLLAPYNISRVAAMAELYLTQKNPDKAVKKYRDLIALNPDDPSVKFSAYDELSNHGYVDQAASLCAETSTPKEVIRHFNNKGVMYSKKGDFVSAIDEYGKAKQYAPNSRDLYRILYNMAIAHINLKNEYHLSQAKQVLEEILRIQPDYDKAKEKLDLVTKHLSKLSA